jgi:hypothetical protein
MSNLAKVLKDEQQNFAAIMAYTTGKTVEEVMPLILSELDNIETIAISKPDIEKCLPISIKQAVKSSLRQNLSLSQEAGLMYLTTRNAEVDGKWIKLLEAKKTARGEISFQRQCGRILDIKSPKIEYNEKQQVQKITVEYLVPSHPQPRWEVKEFDINFFKRLMIASHKERSRGKKDANNEALNYANALYRSHNGWIDPEFAATKAVRHAIKNLGGNMAELKAQKVQEQILEAVSVESAYNEVMEVEYEEENTTNNAFYVQTHEIINPENIGEL